MSELDTLREWFAFNARNRLGYLSSFANLPRKELSRDRGASYPTLLGIFEHSVRAYLSWIVRASAGNADLPQIGTGPDRGPGPDPTVDGIRRFEEEVQALVNRFLDGLVERDLDRNFRIPRDEFFTREHVISIRDMLWHLVEEDLQHRGELNALLWQIDVDPPILDWIEWVEQPKRPQREGNTHPPGQ